MERITQETARRHILSRQGLAKRFSTPEAALGAVVAVQSQYPASVGPALAARAVGANAIWLERALVERRTILKGWSLRITLHASLAADHMMFVRAFESGHLRRYAQWVGRHGVAPDEMADLFDQVWKALGDRPMGRRELHEEVPFFKGRPIVGWGMDAMGLALQGKVVLSRQAAARTEFVKLGLWSPECKPCALSEVRARSEIARRYFGAYGPATRADFLYWTGLDAGRGRAALDSIREDLTEVDIEGKGGAHYMLGPVDPGESFPVRLLPKFDPLMMGWKDKMLFLPDEIRSQVFRKAGQVEAVVLAEGQVRAGWRATRKGSQLTINIEPFGNMKKVWTCGIEREARTLARALGFDKATVLT